MQLLGYSPKVVPKWFWRQKNGWTIYECFATSRECGIVELLLARGAEVVARGNKSMRLRIVNSDAVVIEVYRRQGWQIAGWICFEPQKTKADFELVGTGRFELPTPRTPSECSTRFLRQLPPTSGMRPDTQGTGFAVWTR